LDAGGSDPRNPDQTQVWRLTNTEPEPATLSGQMRSRRKKLPDLFWKLREVLSVTWAKVSDESVDSYCLLQPYTSRPNEKVRARRLNGCFGEISPSERQLWRSGSVVC
jgi:hypothetical protein